MDTITLVERYHITSIWCTDSMWYAMVCGSDTHPPAIVGTGPSLRAAVTHCIEKVKRNK